MTLDTLKNLFCWMGIIQFESHPNRVVFAAILQAICSGIFALYALTTFWFFAFDAVTFADYSRSFFFLVTAMLCASWYMTYLMYKDEFADIFDELNNIIEKSERIVLKLENHT